MHGTQELTNVLYTQPAEGIDHNVVKDCFCTRLVTHQADHIF